MKNYFQRTLLVVLLFPVYLNGQNLLNGPECVVYDSINSRYLVSNWNDGNIVAIDTAGNQFYFKQGLGHALGNCIAGETFYVSIETKILGLNLSNPDDTVMYLPIPGTTQMDGMTVDDDNNLYVLASYQAKLIKINLVNQTYSVFVDSGISARPQDVIFDKKYNRLLICSWYDNSPIQAVNLNDTSITDLVLTPWGNCDGLALGNNGKYYFSSWATNSVHSYDSAFTNPPALFSSGHSGPSNIYFNTVKNEIAIPCFNANRLDIVPIIPVKVNKNYFESSGFELMQNYPNPFNPSTQIDFFIPENAFVSLKLYNVLGNEIATLVNEFISAGKHTVGFNASNLPGNKQSLASGVYIYQLKVHKKGNLKDYFISTKKMMLLK